MNDRMSRMRKRAAPVRLNLLMGSLRILLFVLLCEVIYFLYTSPQFEVRKIKIDRLKTLTNYDVCQKIDIDSHANLFKVNLVSIRRKLEREPRVRKAVLTRLLPDCIVIKLTERQPLAQVAMGNRFVVADEMGVLFAKLSSPQEDLPMVYGFAGGFKKLVLGQKLSDLKLQRAIKCIRIMRRNGLKAISNLEIDEKGALTVNMSNGLKVFLGEPANLFAKIGLCKAVLDKIQSGGNEAEYVDLRCPEAPVWKEKQHKHKHEADDKSPA